MVRSCGGICICANHTSSGCLALSSCLRFYINSSLCPAVFLGVR